MRSYSQFCSVARALDVVGERWTLLIVRELLLRGPSRYTDIRAGLPGIATNLLADRLRQLESTGIVHRVEAPPPVATTLFGLTPRGEQLRRVIEELMAWGVPLMAEGPAPGDVFRSRWLAGPAETFLSDRDPDGPPVRIEVRTRSIGEPAGPSGASGAPAADEPAVIEAAGGRVSVRAGAADDPDAVIAGEPLLVLGLVSGELTLADAESRGLAVSGSRAALERVLPASGAARDRAPKAAVHPAR